MGKERLVQMFTLMQEYRGFSVGKFTEPYEEQLKNFEKVKTSPFYFYTAEPSLLGEDEIPQLRWYTTTYYYRDVDGNRKHFERAQEALVTIGRRLLKTEPAVQDLVNTSEELLKNSYSLLGNYLVINAAKPGFFTGYSVLTGPVQYQYKRFLKEVVANKPDSFRETMRRYLPRWMTFPVAYPETKLPPYSLSDTDWLIDPEQFQAGKLPAHLILKMAKDLESVDKNLAYSLRTSVILQILSMERERFEGATDPEVPLFTPMFAGLITGETRKVSPGKLFDLQAAMAQTMPMTFARLERGDSLERNAAMGFLKSLGAFYPKDFPELVARSLLDYIDKSGEFDKLYLLSELDHSGLVPGLVAAAEALPERRVLRMTEIEKLAYLIQPEAANDSMAEGKLVDDVSKVLGKNDSYRLRASLSKLGVLKAGLEGEVEVDIDGMSQLIEGRLRLVTGQQVRIITLRLIFGGEKKWLEIENIEDENSSEFVTRVFFDLIAGTLAREAAKKQPEAASVYQNKRQPITSVSPAAPTVTREERIRRYSLLKQAETDKRKRRLGVSTGTVSQSGNAFSQVVETKESNRQIVGLDLENVQKLLDQEGIEAIDAGQVVKKLNRVLEIAEVSGQMLGKRINTRDFFGDVGDEVNLREVKWTLDGGKTAIRIFLQDVGKGRFVLQGILYKKGENQQTRFIRRLVTQILKQG